MSTGQTLIIITTMSRVVSRQLYLQWYFGSALTVGGVSSDDRED